LRSAILKSPGHIEIQELPRPLPAEGEVLVKVMAALTCGTDLKAYLRGHKLIPMPGPFGHEYSGIIAETGRGVARFRAGDAVMGVHSAPCLKCAYCRKKIHNLCENIMETKVLGSFSEYLLIPAEIVRQNLYKKPDHLGFDEAAFLEPLACVVHGMEPLKIAANETMLVIGAGPIGLLHLLFGRAKGAKVLVADIEKKRLRKAKEIGADMVSSPDAAYESAMKFTAGMGVDYVFECTGIPEVWESSVRYVRRGGTVVLFGGCRKDTKVTYDTERLHYDEITLRGTFHFTPRDVRKACMMLSSGSIDVSPLISGVCSLKGIDRTMQRLAKGDGIKYVVRP
jgi:L-iditol 2-dehydrogenase